MATQAQEVQEFLAGKMKQGESWVHASNGDVRLRMADGSVLWILSAVTGAFQFSRCQDQLGRFEDEKL